MTATQSTPEVKPTATQRMCVVLHISETHVRIVDVFAIYGNKPYAIVEAVDAGKLAANSDFDYMADGDELAWDDMPDSQSARDEIACESWTGCDDERYEVHITG